MKHWLVKATAAWSNIIKKIKIRNHLFTHSEEYRSACPILRHQHLSQQTWKTVQQLMPTDRLSCCRFFVLERHLGKKSQWIRRKFYGKYEHSIFYIFFAKAFFFVLIQSLHFMSWSFNLLKKPCSFCISDVCLHEYICTCMSAYKSLYVCVD